MADAEQDLDPRDTYNGHHRYQEVHDQFFDRPVQFLL
jgi:hypothetical protein